MHSLTRRRFGGALLVTAGAQLLPAAWAQAYPSKPVKLIAPFPPGGGVDSVARLIAERLSVRIGQAIVIENRPGAGSTIGAEAFAKSPADGYTLMLGSVSSYAIAPHMYKNLAFDMPRDFVSIVEIGNGTVGLVVTADLPVKNLQELIALAKSKPGELSYASSGIGGVQHLYAEMFKQMTGVNMVHVPYKGTSQMLPDLISGRVPITFDSMPAHLPHLKSGKLRALAVTNKARAQMLPDVPTMAEAGLPGYEAATNYTLFGLAKSPRETNALLNKETNAVLQQQELRDKLLALGITVTGGSTEAAQAYVPVEMARWAGVIKAANLKLD